MMRFPSNKTPVEILTRELNGAHGQNAPLFAAGLIAGLRAAGYIILRDDAIRLAQVHARMEALEAATG